MSKDNQKNENKQIFKDNELQSKLVQKRLADLKSFLTQLKDQKFFLKMKTSKINKFKN